MWVDDLRKPFMWFSGYPEPYLSETGFFWILWVANGVLPFTFIACCTIQCLYGVGFFTLGFWKRMYRKVRQFFHVVSGMLLFLVAALRCRGRRERLSILNPETKVVLNATRDQKSQEESDTVLKAELLSADLQPSQPAQSKETGWMKRCVSSKCGTCGICRRNMWCPVKFWRSLAQLRYQIGFFIWPTVICGVTALVLNILLVCMPDNRPPLINAEDRWRKILIGVAPEWPVAVALGCQAVGGVLLHYFVSKAMEDLVTMEPSVLSRQCRNLRYRITIVFTGLCLWLVPCVLVSTIIWVVAFQSSNVSVPISSFWSALLALLWVLLASVTACLWITVLFKPASTGSAAPIEAVSVVSVNVPSERVSNAKKASFSKIREPELGNDPCGCSCCAPSSEKAFRFQDSAPESDASWISRLTFKWIAPFLAYGFARHITQGDLPKPLACLESPGVDETFLKILQAELDANGEKASMKRVCGRFTSTSLLQTGLLKFCYDTLYFSGPLLLRWLLTVIEDAAAAASTASNNHFVGMLFVRGMGVILLMFLSSSIQTFILHRYFHTLFCAGLRLRSGFIGAVYRKSLRIPAEEECDRQQQESDASENGKATPTRRAWWKRYILFWRFQRKRKDGASAEAQGTSEENGSLDDSDNGDKKNEDVKKHQQQVVNLVSVDCQRLYDCCPYIHLLWSSPYQIILALVSLWFQVGYSMLAGLALMCACIPLTSYLAHKMKQYQQVLMRIQDERVKFTSETLSGIKIVKVYAWEESFLQTIFEIRERELKQLWRYSLLNMAFRFLWTATPGLVALVTLFFYVKTNHELTPKTVFSAITVFNLLRFPLVVFPRVISLATDASVACERIQKFLLRAEVPLLPAPPPYSITEPSVATVEAKNLWLRWPNGAPLLKDISFKCYPGTVTAIIGRTGVGKTGLLLSIIGDLPPSPPFSMSEHLRSSPTAPLADSLKVVGRLAYVAQTPWIQNATVRENILFGKEYDASWYSEVVQACALLPDMLSLPYGDGTEIGEKGVNLSGGQKQRVALARAVYQSQVKSSMRLDEVQTEGTSANLPADIYVLDDCLSAVDAEVGQHIFSKCIRGLLAQSNRTVVLVTHKVAILPHVDQVVLLGVPDLSSDEVALDQYAVSDPKNGLAATTLAVGTHASLEQVPEYIKLVRAVVAEETSPEAVPSEDPPSLFYEDLQSSDNVASVTHHPDEGIDRATSVLGIASSEALASEVLPELEERVQKAIEALKKRHSKRDIGCLTEQEAVQLGAVKGAVYRSYFNGLGGPRVVVWVVLLFVLSQGFQVGENLWLSAWSDPKQGITSVSTGTGIYGLLCGLEVVFTFIALYSFTWLALSASRFFHVRLLKSIIRAPMHFFDATPLGRIINRFAKDLSSIDQVIPSMLTSYLSNLLSVVSTLLVICIAAPWFSCVAVPLLFFYLAIQKYYVSTSRQLQRLDSVLKSPMFAHLSETLCGVSTIRAYRDQKRFCTIEAERRDAQQRAGYLLVSSNRWLAIRLEFLGTLVVACAGLFVFLAGLNATISAGIAGVAVSYSLGLTQTLNWMVRLASDCETNIVAVERVEEYAQEVPQEAPAYLPAVPVASRRRSSSTHSLGKSNINATWTPQHGAITFVDYSLRYRPKLPLALDHLNIAIRPSEKIGVVGRTGAGKSSLLAALLRLVEPASGTILVDGVDIQKLGLYTLRSAFSIIPQDPILFTGSLRFNVDPFHTSTDEEVLGFLRKAHLGDFVTTTFSGGLDGPVGQGGALLSHGQRQLVCLARALLRKSPILLLDEATAAVDPETDRLVQRTIREDFQQCTVLTIAHRLETIVDYDRILLLSNGKVAEFDTPLALFNDPNSMFHLLCEDAGLTL